MQCSFGEFYCHDNWWFIMMEQYDFDVSDEDSTKYIHSFRSYAPSDWVYD